MSVSVNQIMERLGSTQTMKVIKFIEDCFDEMAMGGSRETQVTKLDIEDDLLRYAVPLTAAKIISVSALYQEADGTELMESEDQVLTAGTSNWTNGDFATFDKVGDLSVLCGATGQYCYLDDDDILTKNKIYNLLYDLTVSAGASFQLQSFDSSDVLGTFAAGTQNEIRFTATETSEIKIVGTGLGTGDFDNFSLEEVPLSEYREISRMIGQPAQNYQREES